MWAVGCVFVELLTLRPFIKINKGQSSFEALQQIFSYLGTPDWSSSYMQNLRYKEMIEKFLVKF
jgi:hypothetical protein